MTAQGVVLLIIALAAYLLAGFIGFRNPSSYRWVYIDPFYYPIAAFGVVLLFLLNTGQRRQLELIQNQNRTQTARDTLTTKKPSVNVSLNSQLLDSASSIISSQQQLADTFLSYATFTPSCEVAKKLSPAYSRFLRARSVAAVDDVERVSAYCTAGDTMLKEITSEDEMSSLVSSELMSQYRRMLEKQYSAYDIEAIKTEANNFRGRTLAKVAALEPYLAMEENQDNVKFAFQENREEIDAGASIILALGPCVSAPHKELNAFLDWSAATVRANEQVQQIKDAAKAVKDEDSRFSWPRWFNLTLWPYLLILASSLKFSKAIAQVRKTSLDKAAKCKKP